MEQEERKYRQRLKEKYGDEYSEEVELDLMDRYMDDNDTELSNYKDAETKFAEVLQGNPEFAAMLIDITEGASPAVAFIKAFGPEALEAIEGEEDYEANMKARADRAEKTKKQTALLDEISNNEAESIAAIDAFAEANGMDADVLIEQIGQVFRDALHKKVTPEFLMMLKNAGSYTQDVDAARQAGETIGRNESIEATKAKEKMRTDGVPAGGADAGKSRQKTMLDYVKEM